VIAGLLVAATMGRAQARQSAKVFRLAFVDLSIPKFEIHTSYLTFFAELWRLGYVEGQNLVIEPYSLEGRTFHNPELTREVVRSNPDVIVAAANPLVLDFKAATTSIPIVGFTADPIALVSWRASPGRVATSRGLPAMPGSTSGPSVSNSCRRWHQKQPKWSF
jgi:putative tryptophan/tyrosine transport system substrate-binding protein